MKTKTVIFNVGGALHEVTQTLLDQYPDSMLTKSASKEWYDSDEKEIFIERDGSTFKYVLNFMRDGKVALPLTQTKAATILELEYFNINFDPANIDDSASSLQAVPLLNSNYRKKFKDWTKKFESNIRRDSFIIACFNNYFTEREGLDEMNHFFFYQDTCVSEGDVDYANKALRELGIKIINKESTCVYMKHLSLDELQQDLNESDDSATT